MLPTTLHIGAAKAASTYLWQLCKEHPECFTPPNNDNCSFFECAWHKGLDWYKNQYFSSYNGEKVVVDFSNGYMLSEPILARIKKALPNVLLTVTLRDPVEITFEQWVMHKRGKKELGEVWEHDMGYQMDRSLIRAWWLFRLWVEPGFYADHMKKVYRHFEKEKVFIMFYDDLVADDEMFVQKYFDFIGADPGFKPASLKKRVGFPGDKGQDTIGKDIARGLNPEHAEALRIQFHDDICELEDITGRDLTHWKDGT